MILISQRHIITSVMDAAIIIVLLILVMGAFVAVLFFMMRLRPAGGFAAQATQPPPYRIDAKPAEYVGPLPLDQMAPHDTSIIPKRRDPRTEPLPRCPRCGTAIAYGEEKCPKCGLVTRKY
jgi:hypothetical protein